MLDWIAALPPAKKALAIMLVTLLCTLAVGRLAGWIYSRRSDNDPIAIHATTTILMIMVALVGIVATLDALGVHLGAVLTGGGFIALGAGIGARNIIENYISGIMVRIEGVVRPGDLIEVNGLWLMIGKVGFRTTTAMTYSAEEKLIPNTMLAQSIVTSLTRSGRQFRIGTQVGVRYESDMNLVRKTLEETVSRLEWRSKVKDPAVHLSEFAESAVVFDIKVWIDDAGDSGARESDLHESIWWAPQKAGITMAGPRLDVRLDPPAPGDSRPGEEK